MAKKKTIGSEYILLDRSGSMASRWQEALSSINSYVKALEKGVTVTLAVFDEQRGLQFDVIRDNVATEKWEDVTDKDATPRGMTPLYDAISRIVALAETKIDEKVVIVIMTDGAENASREVTQAGAKAALDRCRQKNWQVVFLGADFDAFNQASFVGTGAGQTINTVSGNYGATMSVMAEKTRLYRSSGPRGQTADVSFDATDRDIAMGKTKK